jgi:hypothetical protein
LAVFLPVETDQHRGNVYSGGSGGIILDPKGKKLGRIVHGYPSYDQCRLRRRRLENPLLHQPEQLGAVNVKISGIPVPVPTKKQG